MSGTVGKLSDGHFVYTGGIWEGQAGDMGPSAVLEVGALRILVMSYATYDWSDEQFRSMDLEARRAKFVVVKNPMNYRLGYEGISKSVLFLDTPGPTPATLERAPFRKLQRPYYPADQDIPGLQPVIYHHVSQAV